VSRTAAKPIKNIETIDTVQEKLPILTQKQVPKGITIYMPTTEAWVNWEKSAIRLKNLLNVAEEELTRQGLRPVDARNILLSARALIDNQKFWKNQKEGLVIFISEMLFEHYKSRVRFTPMVVVQDHFYLKPLVPVIYETHSYYLLSLSQKAVNLYEGHYNELTRIKDKLLPKDIDEALWMDDPEKSVKYYRTKGERVRGRAGMIFHGDGGIKDAHKTNLFRYSNIVDERVNKILKNKELPMILACVDYLFPIYKKANIYPNLLDIFIEGNPDNISKADLGNKAWEMVESHFKEEKRSALEKFKTYSATDKTLTTIDKIVKATFQARVESMFVDPDKSIWGKYDAENNTVDIKAKKEYDEEELLNLSLIQTVRNGGKVFPAKTDGRGISHPYGAILRF
jgi:hypothetical protein